MNRSRQVIIAGYIAAFSLTVSAVSTIFVAYQTFLTRESIELARVANVQQLQISACDEIIRSNPLERMRSTGVRASISYAEDDLEAVSAISYPIAGLMIDIDGSSIKEYVERSVGYRLRLERLPVHLDALRGVVDPQFGEILLSTRKSIDHYLIVNAFLDLLSKDSGDEYLGDARVVDILRHDVDPRFDRTDLSSLTLKELHEISFGALTQLNDRLDQISRRCQVLMFGQD